MSRSTVSLSLSLVVMGFIACDSATTEPPPRDGFADSGTSGTVDSGGSSSGGADAAGDTGGGTPDGGTGADADAGAQWVGPDGGVTTAMTFFVTSRGPGNGGDLRGDAGGADGLAGADAFCKQLATAVSPILGQKTWRAYLSTATITARSRVGNGPWYNAKGVVIANSAAQLHDEGSMNLLTLTTDLDELGAQVPINAPNLHDILTGSTAAGGTGASHCTNWTSNATNVTAVVGHSNRAGGGAAPTSWNAAHATAGCAEIGAGSVRSGGGRGSFYCFAN